MIKKALSAKDIDLNNTYIRDYLTKVMLGIAQDVTGITLTEGLKATIANIATDMIGNPGKKSG